MSFHINTPHYSQSIYDTPPVLHPISGDAKIPLILKIWNASMNDQAHTLSMLMQEQPLKLDDPLF